MAVLPGVLGYRSLRRTVKVRLGTNTLRLPGGTPIFAVSRQQFMKYPGESELIEDIRLKADVRISTFVLGGFLSLGTMPKSQEILRRLAPQNDNRKVSFQMSTSQRRDENDTKPPLHRLFP